MGHWSLTVLSLAVLLSAANSSPPVDIDQLANLVSQILNRYRPTYVDNEQQPKTPMFSLAVRIPFNKKTKRFDIEQVHDDASTVKNTIINCNVYTGEKVVAATVLRWPDVVTQCPNGLVQWGNVVQRAKTWADVYNQDRSAFDEGTADHAEYRTLQKLNTLRNNENDLLLIYVFASPCASRCTNTNKKANILELLRPYQKFKVVFVFSKIFKPRNSTSVPAEQLEEALRKLGGAIGLERIFRCDGPNAQMHCMNCDYNGEVARWCHGDNQQPG